MIKIAITTVVMLSLAACAKPSLETAVVLGPDDPSAAVSPVGYRSTLAGYRSLRPTGPGDWKATNEKVTPKPKPVQGGSQ